MLHQVWNYDTESASDTGTLFAARNFLKARNVPANPMSHFTASNTFKRSTHSCVCSHDLFWRGTTNEEPKKNIFRQDEQTADVIHSKLGHLLDTFAIPSSEEISAQINHLSCPVQGCKKPYKTLKGLKDHIKMKHGPDAPEPLLLRQSQEGDDKVFNYSRIAPSLCLLGLLCRMHNC